MSDYGALEATVNERNAARKELARQRVRAEKAEAEVERLKGVLETARLFIVDQYETEADADKGEWLAAEARPIYASICKALEAKP